MLTPDALRSLAGSASVSYDDVTRVWGFQSWIRTDSARRMLLIEDFYHPLGEDARAGGGWVLQFLKRFRAMIPSALTRPDPYARHELNAHGALVPPTDEPDPGALPYAA